MSAREPGQASRLFERRFADGDLDGLVDLYETDAVFPTESATARGQDEIRETLKGYLESGAALVFGEPLVFPAGDLALIHTPWTMTMPNGASSGGATAEVLRCQADGSWKYIIDNPDGTALLDHDQNKVIARRLLEEILSADKLEAIPEVVAAGYREHDPANEVDTQGAEGMREEFAMFRSAFGFRFTVEDQIADGDKVANRWTFRGRHIGEFAGAAATGNDVEMDGQVIFRFADGMIQEAWWNWDVHGLMQQIGVIAVEQPA